jgi:hypothetical protein
MSQCLRVKEKNKRIITQISENEYLVEGESDWVRFGCQSDISVITSANLDGGPFLLVGDSFLGKGKISAIQNIDSDRDGYIIIKVTLYSSKEKE